MLNINYQIQCFSHTSNNPIIHKICDIGKNVNNINHISKLEAVQNQSKALNAINETKKQIQKLKTEIIQNEDSVSKENLIEFLEKATTFYKQVAKSVGVKDDTIEKTISECLPKCKTKIKLCNKICLLGERINELTILQTTEEARRTHNDFSIIMNSIMPNKNEAKSREKRQYFKPAIDGNIFGNIEEGTNQTPSNQGQNNASKSWCAIL